MGPVPDLKLRHSAKDDVERYFDVGTSFTEAVSGQRDGSMCGLVGSCRARRVRADPDAAAPAFADRNDLCRGSLSAELVPDPWAIEKEIEQAALVRTQRTRLAQIDQLGDVVTHFGDGSLGLPGCLVAEAENTPAEPDPVSTGEGST